MVDKVLLVSYEGCGNCRVIELFSLSGDIVRVVSGCNVITGNSLNEIRLEIREECGIEINTNKVVPIPISMNPGTPKLKYIKTDIADYIKNNKRLMSKFYRPKVVK